MKRFALNCLGETCPVPLEKTQQMMHQLKVGDILVITLDHGCAMKSIPEWAYGVGYYVEVEEYDNGVWEVIIEKSH